MLEYFKMKRNEVKVKSVFYKLIGDIIDNQKEYVIFAQNLYNSLKDAPIDELRSEFIEKIAEYAYKKSETIEDNRNKQSNI